MSTRDADDRFVDAEEQLVRWALGEMAEDEAAAFTARLAQDPELAVEARALRRSFESIGHASVEEPPPALRGRVLDAVRASNVRALPVAAPSPIALPPARSRALLFAALAAAAAAIFVAVGVAVDDLRLRRELALLTETMDTLHQPNVVLDFALVGEGDYQPASGRAVLDLDAKKAALVVSGLAARTDGRVYTLWALVGDEHVACGRFDSSPDARIVRQFPIPVRDYSDRVRGLIVTLEPDGTDAPTGPIVMRTL